MGLAHCCQEKQEKTDLKCISIKRISHSNKSLMPRLEQIKNRTNDCFLTPTTQTRMKQNSYNNTPIHPKTHSKTLFREEEKKKRTPEDFQQIRYLGKGAFGCVVLVRQKASGCKYAIKIIQKSKIKEFNLLQCDRIKEIGLQNFFVTIKQTFQNQTNIYIVMQYLPVGDLYYYLLKKETPFTQDVIAKIISEIIVSIEYLHSKGIIYRELKPQNLLITDQGHIKLTDYGLSKVIIENRKSIQTFVGTIQYMAPQALVGGFGQKADIWSIGMLMYELFFKQNLMELDDSRITMILKGGVFPIEKQVIQNKINSKIGFMSLKFRDLLLKILDKDPEKRISLQKMKSHDFFKGINWKSVELRQNEPPLKELIQKKSLMRFRDPTIEKRYRNEFVKERTLKENYQFELYQFCISQ